MDDNEFYKEWSKARRLYHGRYGQGGGSLAKRIALSICDDLEAAGYTEADVDRIELSAHPT